MAIGQTCVITELIPGGDLFSYLHTPGRRSTAPGEAEVLARYITFQLLQALKYLHGRGIAHRDIKVENVLLWSAEAGARVVLTDFGAAAQFSLAGKAASEEVDAGDDQQTRHRMVTQIGTAGNMAPEVVRAGQECRRSRQTDLWAGSRHVVCLCRGLRVAGLTAPGLLAASCTRC